MCGSDGQTYINKCLLDVAACANNKEIQQRHVGPCGKMIYDLSLLQTAKTKRILHNRPPKSSSYCLNLSFSGVKINNTCFKTGYTSNASFLKAALHVILNDRVEINFSLRSLVLVWFMVVRSYMETNFLRSLVGSFQ